MVRTIEILKDFGSYKIGLIDRSKQPNVGMPPNHTDQ